jgi:hypothetical protein
MGWEGNTENLTQRRKGAKVKIHANSPKVRGHRSVTVFNQRVSWWLGLSRWPTRPSLRNRNRSALHGLNLCAFASLREFFSVFFRSLPPRPLRPLREASIQFY